MNQLKGGCSSFTIHAPTIHDQAMHASCVNCPNLLTVYRDNSLYPIEKQYKRNMQRPGFYGEENKLEKSKFFLQIKIIY